MENDDAKNNWFDESCTQAISDNCNAAISYFKKVVALLERKDTEINALFARLKELKKKGLREKELDVLDFRNDENFHDWRKELCAAIAKAIDEETSGYYDWADMEVLLNQTEGTEE